MKRIVPWVGAAVAVGVVVLLFTLNVPRPAAPPTEPVAAVPPSPKPSPRNVVRLGFSSFERTTFALSPDSKLMAKATPPPVVHVQSDGKHQLDFEHRITVTNPATGELLHTLTNPGYCWMSKLMFSPDSQTLFSLDWHTIQSWNMADGSHRREYEATGGNWTRFTLSPDGSMLAMTGHRAESGNQRMWVQFWNTDSEVPLHTLKPNEASPGGIVFAPDGRTLFTAVRDTNDPDFPFAGLIEWDVTTGKELRRLDLRATLNPEPDRKPKEDWMRFLGPMVEQIVFTRDGKRLIVAGGLARLEPDRDTIHHVPYGFVWVIDRDTGKVERTLIRDRVKYIDDIDVTRDGAKLFVRMPLPDQTRYHNSAIIGVHDPEFVEVQQWDVAKWERDWVKVLKPGEAQKLLAAK